MGDAENLKASLSSRRIPSLDGLRGLAAVVVLVHHALLTIPALAAPYYAEGKPAATGTLDWFLIYTPLHIVWAGREGVYLFFILSGMVLMLPVLRNPNFAWRGYYPRRLIRLYIPVIAAVMFGALTLVLVDRMNTPQLGAWVVARPDQYSAESLIRDVTLVFGTSGVVSPLWSLRWEVLFSLVLPLYVLWARPQRWWWAKLALCFAVIAVGGALGSSPLFFMPMFAIGSLLASRWEGISARLSGWLERAWWGPLLAVIAVALTCIRWEVAAFGVPYTETEALGVVSVAGVTLLVLLAALWRPFRTMLTRPTMQWLGGISFSLYLIHEPIILAFRFLTPDLSPWVGIAASVPVSIVAAALFLRWVERPSHRLAQRLGRSGRNRDSQVDQLRP